MFFRKCLSYTGFFFILYSCSHKSVQTQSTKKVDASATNAPFFLTAPASSIEGERVYKSKCGECHKLENPADYTSDQWIRIMKSMAKKAKLNESEKNDVIAFVTSHPKMAQ